jgi:hypothetical protein
MPAVIPPPDEEDVRVAVVRTFEMLGGDRIAPYSVRMFLNPIARALGCGLKIEVQRVSSLSCQPAPNGFVCSYRIQSKNELLNPFANENDSLMKFSQGLVSFLDFPQELTQERFELGLRGWWSPGLQARMRKASQEYNQQLESQLSN